MAKDKTTLRFWLRTDRPNKDGSAPIHMIYQIQGDRKYYAIPGIKLFSVNWNTANQQAVCLTAKDVKQQYKTTLSLLSKAEAAEDDKKVKNLKREINDIEIALRNIKLLSTSSEVNEINGKLQAIRNDIRDIENRFKLTGIDPEPDSVISAFAEIKKPQAKKRIPGTNVIDFISQFVKDSAASHRTGTLKVYTGLAAHLSDFETSTGVKITFETIDISLLRSFTSFLFTSRYRQLEPDRAAALKIQLDLYKQGKKGKIKTENDYKKILSLYSSGILIKSMNSITAAKQISTLKTILNNARTIYKINVKLDYRDFKISRKDSELEVITMTQDEFMELYNLDLTKNKKLDAVRDVFCFSCATGLRYSDLDQLRREHIRKDNTIRMTAAKTGQKLVIPLNPISYSILQKYVDKLRPLPIISNQKTNDYIKELGKLAGIDTPIEKVRTQGVKKVTKVSKKFELMSIHFGRKSFITLSLEKGAAVQEVMALTGHTSFKAFKRYVDVSDSRKKTVMANAWGPVPKSNLKVV